MEKMLCMKSVPAFFVICVLCTLQASGQSQANPFMNDADGRPFYQKTEYNAEGSPYFYNDYCVAEITSMNGTVYRDVKVKVNLVENELLYMAPDGMELVARTPIRSVKFFSHLEEGKAYGEAILQNPGGALNSPDSKIYQVLVDSGVLLLKEVAVTYTDSKRYGEATITRVFTRNETLYSLPLSAARPVRLEKSKNGVAALFGDKATTVKKYIEDHKLSCRSESDLVKIFRHSASL